MITPSCTVVPDDMYDTYVVYDQMDRYLYVISVDYVRENT